MIKILGLCAAILPLVFEKVDDTFVVTPKRDPVIPSKNARYLDVKT